MLIRHLVSMLVGASMLVVSSGLLASANPPVPPPPPAPEERSDDNNGTTYGLEDSTTGEPPSQRDSQRRPSQGSGSGNSGSGGRAYPSIPLDELHINSGGRCNPSDRLCSIPTGGGGGGGNAAPPAPTIDPGVAARRAVARITLKASSAELTPDWNKNRFKMLAVGFPVWVSVDDDSLVAPADSMTVEGLSVSLRANKPRVAVDMGDGTTLRCALKGRKFNYRDIPGSDGPCSHRYQKMSPKDGYQVTTTYTWDIDWSAGGQSGTITTSDSETVRIPIGELQALITAPR